MTKQKKGFWLFMFSLIPGAGEMYMGFKKQGLSSMAIFWLLIAIASFTGRGEIMMILPILWFYSFFNVHNLNSLSEEEFYSVEDNYILNVDQLVINKKEFVKRYRFIFAIALILIGASLLWQTLLSSLYPILPPHLHEIVFGIGNMVPDAVIAIAIIYLGIYLIIGKKKSLSIKADA